jgi:putative membrane protein
MKKFSLALILGAWATVGVSLAAVTGVSADFANKAAKDGQAEVRMGQMLQKMSSNKDIQAFGAMLVTDHTKANQQLTELAKKKGTTLPSDIGAVHGVSMVALGMQEGAAFDRMAMHMAVMDHQKAVDLFRQQSLTGNDAEMKAFAAKTLPTLEDHLSMAQHLHDQIQ